MLPITKWIGSKRYQAPDIVSHFPKEINTYYEPFVGGGALLFELSPKEISVNTLLYDLKFLNDILFSFILLQSYFKFCG